VQKSLGVMRGVRVLPKGMSGKSLLMGTMRVGAR
jgi:hypothetical protein